MRRSRGSRISEAEAIGQLAIITGVGALAYTGPTGFFLGVIAFIGWILYCDRKRK